MRTVDLRNAMNEERLLYAMQTLHKAWCVAIQRPPTPSECSALLRLCADALTLSKLPQHDTTTTFSSTPLDKPKTNNA